MTPPDAAPWSGTAFGLDLYGRFPAPGLAGGTPSASSGRSTHLTLVERGELAGTSEPAETFHMARDRDGAFVFDHPFHGRHRVSPEGTEVCCAPPPELPEWLWQRLLVGQLLPLASLLQGCEPLHASAVAIGGRALLLMGTSGAGKSSVALHLAAAGASLIADDVSALELRGDTVVLHPGPGLASIDQDELARMPPEATAAWSRLGTHDGEVRVVIDRGSQEALPVGAVCVLNRRSDIETLGIGEPSLLSPKVLLGGTFNAYVQEPARLARQLKLSGRLAETVELREVRIPPGAGAAHVAGAISATCREWA